MYDIRKKERVGPPHRALEEPINRLTTQCDQDCGGGDGERVQRQQLNRLEQRCEVGRQWRHGYTASQWESLDFNPNLSMSKLYILDLLFLVSFSRFAFSKSPLK